MLTTAPKFYNDTARSSRGVAESRKNSSQDRNKVRRCMKTLDSGFHVPRRDSWSRADLYCSGYSSSFPIHGMAFQPVSWGKGTPAGDNDNGEINGDLFGLGPYCVGGADHQMN